MHSAQIIPYCNIAHLGKFFASKPSGSFRQQPPYYAFACTRTTDESYSETNLVHTANGEHWRYTIFNAIYKNQ